MCEKCDSRIIISSGFITCRGGNMMAGGAALLAASLLPFGSARADQPVLTAPPNAIPPAEALERLMQGNARYVAGETECRRTIRSAAPSARARNIPSSRC